MYYVGCSGWYYEHWRGLFYPEELPRSRWLSYYAQHFPTVEVNSTFYHLPKEKTVQGWRRRTPEGFVLSLKMSRYVSHILRFEDAEEPIAQFYTLARALGSRLGCILIQLPPSMRKDMALLETILSQLDTNLRNAIEFRHASWLIPEVYRTLDDRGVAMCLVSSSRMNELVEGYEPSVGFGYVRFHGLTGYAHDYSHTELRRWAERIERIEGDVYVYFNNDFNARAVKNARELAAMLK